MFFYSLKRLKEAMLSNSCAAAQQNKRKCVAKKQKCKHIIQNKKYFFRSSDQKSISFQRFYLPEASYRGKMLKVLIRTTTNT